jgi:hypothetical protein
MKKLIALTIGLFLSFTGLSQSCLQEGIIFTMQAQIDSFQVNYPGCTEIEGDILIYGSDITNLSGLNVLTATGGDFEIGIYEDPGNPNLTSLAGLESLTSIGGGLLIYSNEALASLAGLDNLTSISNGYWGHLDIHGNPVLTSLTALGGLTTMYGAIYITENSSLTSLSGLDNITLGIINGLYFLFNANLSTCEVQSICNYLADPYATVQIGGNEEGCNSQAEVEAACGVGLNENNSSEDQFTIAPNPSSTQITIETSSTPTKFQFSIFNLNGQELIRRQITEPRTVIDIGDLPGGVYFVRLTGERTVSVEKFIKMD